MAASPEGLAATLERYREDDLTNALQIQVVNGSGRTIELTSLQLVWPGLREQPPVTTPHAMSAGQIADLPVAAGEAICSDPPRLDERLPDSPALALQRAADVLQGQQRFHAHDALRRGRRGDLTRAAGRFGRDDAKAAAARAMRRACA